MPEASRPTPPLAQSGPGPGQAHAQRSDGGDAEAGAVAPSRIFKPPGWDWAQRGEVGWWLRPGWQETLLGPEGLRLEQWRTEGKLTTIKSGPLRAVYRVDLPDGAVYVKHFLVPNFRARFRQWVRRGKGRNEGKRALRLAEIGVATITPIALGEQRKRKFLFENYLITHALAGMYPLDEFVERHVPQLPLCVQMRLRRKLAEALAELTAHLHEAGFVHGDFHPGNLLVRLLPDGTPVLAMIDLDALRVRKKLSWNDAQANLALLNHYFWFRSERVDRHRFLRAYLRARQGEQPDIRAFARGVEASTRHWAERLWKRAGKRCRGTNKYFAVFREPNAWAIASRGLDPATVQTLLADPEKPFSAPGAIILKDSRTNKVAELTLPAFGRPTRVIYKRFNRRAWLDPVLSLFRPSRAWRAWQAGQHLDCRGVPTPKNLAIVARAWEAPRRSLGVFLPSEMYLLNVKAEPAITLFDYLQTIWPGLDPAARRVQIQKLTLALARLIRTLHERSLSNRDLKAANILIEGDPAAAVPRLSLIDLVGVGLAHPLPSGRRMQNLARLQVSLAHVAGRTRTDSLRFLRAYLTSALTPPGGWKQVWRAVARRTRQKEERNRRTGRPLS